MAPRIPGHVLRSAVVLEDVELLYVPVPKAGCTAILKALAEVAGLPDDELARSPEARGHARPRDPRRGRVG